MIAITIVFCLVAMMLQVAVLRDQTIPEAGLKDRARLIRVVAYVVGAASLSYTWYMNYWVNVPMVLSINALALSDIMSTACRLFPEHRATE